MRSTMSWAFAERDGDVLISLSGKINEDSAFKELLQEIRKRNVKALAFNLKDVRRVNSMGVREWFSFLRQLSWPIPVPLEECSVSFQQALSPIEDFSQTCLVNSLYLDMFCPSCHAEFDIKVELTMPVDMDAEFECPECNNMCQAEMWRVESLCKGNHSYA